jgi:hypothetical protein
MSIKYEKAEGICNTITYTCDSSGCGHIRAIWPNMILSAWKHRAMTFNFTSLPLFVTQPSFYEHFAFVKFQRSATNDQLKIFEYFVKNIRNRTGTGVLYESDDNLFDIPDSNFASRYYRERKSNIEKMLSMVDGITVSTPYLKTAYRKYNKNISVIKNHLPKCLWGNVKQPKAEQPEKIRIVYPGSQNHFSQDPNDDRGDMGKVLINFIKKTKDLYEWIFIGGCPLSLKDDVKYIPWVNIIKYPSFLKNMDFDIGIAPLDINEFNKSKSDLKMLEFVVCGACGIYTDIEPYKKATNKAKTEEEFVSLIENLASDPLLREKTWKKDYATVKNSLFFEDNMLQWVNNHLRLFNKGIK